MALSLSCWVCDQHVYIAGVENRGFTTGLFKNGTSALVGLFIPAAVQPSVLSRLDALYKGAVLTALKYIIGVLIGWGLNRVFGPAGILGLTPLAVITAVTNSNGAIYTALAKEFGDSTDVGAIAILSLNDGPFLTMIALGATGLAEIPLISIIAVIVPLFIGMFLGNADEEFKMLLTNGLAMLLPFNGFVLGANMSLMSIVKAGAGGIVLGLVTVVCTGVLTYYIYSAIRRKPIPWVWLLEPLAKCSCSAGLCCNGGSIPESCCGATAQVAASVVVSAILTPLLTGYFIKGTKTS